MLPNLQHALVFRNDAFKNVHRNKNTELNNLSNKYSGSALQLSNRLKYLFIRLFQGHCTLINSQTVSEPELA